MTKIIELVALGQTDAGKAIDDRKSIDLTVMFSLPLITLMYTSQKD